MLHKANFDVIQRINVSELEVRSTDFHKNCQTIAIFNSLFKYTKSRTFELWSKDMSETLKAVAVVSI